MTDWLLATVHDLRRAGFFADPQRSDADVAAYLADDYESAWGHAPARDDELVELELVQLDEDRVWWEDTEADVMPGTNAYVDVLTGLARVSCGAFRPHRVEERWVSPHGPVSVDVDLGDGAIQLRPSYLDDYLDVGGVLRQLNVLALPPDGPTYALYTPFDQTAFVVCVTDAVRGRLEERGWSFADLGER